jgi:hypothetical protein
MMIGNLSSMTLTVGQEFSIFKSLFFRRMLQSNPSYPKAFLKEHCWRASSRSLYLKSYSLKFWVFSVSISKDCWMSIFDNLMSIIWIMYYYHYFVHLIFCSVCFPFIPTNPYYLLFASVKSTQQLLASTPLDPECPLHPFPKYPWSCSKNSSH